jgi:hypothetical protein
MGKRVGKIIVFSTRPSRGVLIGFCHPHFHGRLVIAADANANIAAREAAMFSLTKSSLTTATESLRQSNSRKHIPADAAWDPYLVFQYLSFVSPFWVERSNVGFVPFIHKEASSSRSDLPTNNVDSTGLVNLRIQAKLPIIPFRTTQRDG